MSSKNKGTDYGFGEIFIPVMDLMTHIIMAMMDLIEKGVGLGINKLLNKKESQTVIKKIERTDLKNTKTTLVDEEIGYSVTERRGLKTSEIDKRLHTAVVGASGSGKTVLLDALMYDDMLNGKPVVYLDPKGDNASLENFINLCRLTGRDYQIFSEHYNGYGATSLNPVKDGSVTNIADRIHHAFTWSEEHYELLCYNALKDAISLLQIDKTEVSLESIHTKLLEVSNPDDKENRIHERKNIQGIITRIRNIIDSDFGGRLKGEGALSFNELRGTNKCVYIGLSVLGYAEVARSIGKIFLGDLAYSVYDTYKKTSVANLKELSPVGIYVDELSAVITNEFIEILNKCRGAKMEITFAFQSPSDISKVDPNLCVQVLENASNWFVFKQRMEEGANLFAEAIGTVTSKKQTKRFEDGKEMDQGSEREVEELIAHHNIIKNLRRGQCVLLRHSPTKIDLLNVKYIDPEVTEFNVRFLENEGELETIQPVIIKKEEPATNTVLQ